MNRFKQAIPERGINPILTQQAIPKMAKQDNDVIATVADALAIR